jgi:hypothetical protein
LVRGCVGERSALGDATSVGRVLLLEARARLGGRTHAHSFELPNGTRVYVDAGAAFLHGAFGDELAYNSTTSLALQSGVSLQRAAHGYSDGWRKSGVWFDNLSGAALDDATVERVRRVVELVLADLRCSMEWLSRGAGLLYDHAQWSIAQQLPLSLAFVVARERIAFDDSSADSLDNRLLHAMLTSKTAYVGNLAEVSLVSLTPDDQNPCANTCSMAVAHASGTVLLPRVATPPRVKSESAAAAMALNDEPVAAAAAAAAAAPIGDDSDGSDDSSDDLGVDGLVPPHGYGHFVVSVLQPPAEAEVRTSCVVERIALDDEAQRLVVTFKHADADERVEVTCDYCVCTVPLGVLQAKAIDFAPALSAPKLLAIERLGMGVENKLMMVFERAFWRPTRGYLAVTDSRFRFFDYDHFGTENTLVAFLTPPFSSECGGRAECLATVMASLRLAFGAAVPEPIACELTQWHADPFSRGSYSFLKTGSTQHDIVTLQEPEFGGRLLFAGEATSLLNGQSVNGALNTGILAANVVRRSVPLPPCSMPFAGQQGEQDRCVECKLMWDTESPMLQCDVCDCWMHAVCINVHPADNPNPCLCMRCGGGSASKKKKKNSKPTREESAAPAAAAAAAAVAAPPPPIVAAKATAGKWKTKRADAHREPSPELSTERSAEPAVKLEPEQARPSRRRARAASKGAAPLAGVIVPANLSLKDCEDENERALQDEALKLTLPFVDINESVPLPCEALPDWAADAPIQQHSDVEEVDRKHGRGTNIDTLNVGTEATCADIETGIAAGRLTVLLNKLPVETGPSQSASWAKAKKRRGAGDATASAAATAAAADSTLARKRDRKKVTPISAAAAPADEDADAHSAPARKRDRKMAAPLAVAAAHEGADTIAADAAPARMRDRKRKTPVAPKVEPIEALAAVDDSPRKHSRSDAATPLEAAKPADARKSARRAPSSAEKQTIAAAAAADAAMMPPPTGGRVRTSSQTLPPAVVEVLSSGEVAGATQSELPFITPPSSLKLSGSSMPRSGDVVADDASTVPDSASGGSGVVPVSSSQSQQPVSSQQSVARIKARDQVVEFGDKVTVRDWGARGDVLFDQHHKWPLIEGLSLLLKRRTLPTQPILCTVVRGVDGALLWRVVEVEMKDDTSVVERGAARLDVDLAQAIGERAQSRDLVSHANSQLLRLMLFQWHDSAIADAAVRERFESWAQSHGSGTTCKACKKTMSSGLQNLEICVQCSMIMHSICSIFTGGQLPRCPMCVAIDELPCFVCNKPHRPEDFVLCEVCPRGGHFDCLGLPAVPAGAWYCGCGVELPAATTTAKKPKKRR